MRAEGGSGLRRNIRAIRWTFPIPLCALVVVFGWGAAVELLHHAGTGVTAAIIVAYAAQVGAALALAAGSLQRTDAPPALLPSLVITGLTAGELGAVHLAVSQGWFTGIHAYSAYLLAVLPAAAVWAGRDWRVSGTLALTSCLAAAPHPQSGVVLVVIAGTWGGTAAIIHLYAWSITVVLRLESAQRTESLLAVAEERLRFARDLHDTLGRTLSVVALKSELAARLSGESRARAEMEEVQALALSSQEEIREVVRGYRRVDVEAELEGARSVLAAAGIDCRVSGTEVVGDLDSEDRSVLGWVIREGATNVIRHARATYCTVAFEVDPEAATVMIVNDGAGRIPVRSDRPVVSERGSGTGLAGLEQRLTERGGTLEHGSDGGTYHLRARIPWRREQ
ncbi:histidine kinase [Lipingzhangella sp. LS1_29]|uniref:Histidine kinase n=1 Tax=Lipingzhangella rawalii TaxID=2055835 RepID=A0ABU2HAE7_9ACTN|nr:histidine kinase [Lipingzhangella rawalii]MDS1272277.1 histidine kinase [Lipingzhangella rawalii]